MFLIFLSAVGAARGVQGIRQQALILGAGIGVLVIGSVAFWRTNDLPNRVADLSLWLAVTSGMLAVLAIWCACLVCRSVRVAREASLAERATTTLGQDRN